MNTEEIAKKYYEKNKVISTAFLQRKLQINFISSVNLLKKIRTKNCVCHYSNQYLIRITSK